MTTWLQGTLGGLALDLALYRRRLKTRVTPAARPGGKAAGLKKGSFRVETSNERIALGVFQ